MWGWDGRRVHVEAGTCRSKAEFWRESGAKTRQWFLPVRNLALWHYQANAHNKKTMLVCCDEVE
jgi:hypothetical protein